MSAQLFYPPENFDYQAWRTAGIGGSDAPIIMNASPWMSRRGLWELKTGKRKPEAPTWPMKKGIRMEPVARSWYETQTGILMPKALAIHRDHDFIRLSLDGINQEANRPLEIKCPGKEDHFTAAAGKVPDKYVWQLVHYLLVLNLPHMEYLSYNPRYKDLCDWKDGIILGFERQKELENRLLEALFEFQECIMKDRPPRVEPLYLRNSPKLTLVPKKTEIFKVRKTHARPAKKRTAPEIKKEGVPMEDRGRSENLTGREIVEIMDRAKELGARSIKVGDIEVDFSSAEVRSNRSEGEEAPLCRCGNPRPKGNYGGYLPVCDYCFRSPRNYPGGSRGRDRYRR